MWSGADGMWPRSMSIGVVAQFYLKLLVRGYAATEVRIILEEDYGYKYSYKTVRGAMHKWRRNIARVMVWR